MATIYITRARFNAARERLSEFMIGVASVVIKHHNLRIVLHTQDIAPDLATMNKLLSHQRKLRIWLGASDNTIYTSKTANLAFRIWHDYLHCKLYAGFDEHGERRVFAAQSNHLARRLGGALVAYLFEADTYGQLEYHLKHGKFPDNQLEFAIQYLYDKHHITIVKEVP